MVQGTLTSRSLKQALQIIDDSGQLYHVKFRVRSHPKNRLSANGKKHFGKYECFFIEELKKIKRNAPTLRYI